MAKETTYTTEVEWRGEHGGQVTMGNGPQMGFSAPPDAHGHPGVLTPEDAFVAAANTCIMMMFLWACERFKLDLRSYRCRAAGTKRVELDRTEIFSHVRLWPEITVSAGPEGEAGAVEQRVRKALASAQKYSLVANSIKSEVIVEPSVVVLRAGDAAVTGDSGGSQLQQEGGKYDGASD